MIHLDWFITSVFILGLFLGGVSCPQSLYLFLYIYYILSKKKIPKNIFICFFFSSGKTLLKKKGEDPEDPSNKSKKKKKEDPSNKSEKYHVGFLPKNYETFLEFVKSAYVHTLGLSGVGMNIFSLLIITIFFFFFWITRGPKFKLVPTFV